MSTARTSPARAGWRSVPHPTESVLRYQSLTESVLRHQSLTESARRHQSLITSPLVNSIARELSSGPIHAMMRETFIAPQTAKVNMMAEALRAAASILPKSSIQAVLDQIASAPQMRTTMDRLAEQLTDLPLGLRADGVGHLGCDQSASTPVDTTPAVPPVEPVRPAVPAPANPHTVPDPVAGLILMIWLVALVGPILLVKLPVEARVILLAELATIPLALTLSVRLAPAAVPASPPDQ